MFKCMYWAWNSYEFLPVQVPSHSVISLWDCYGMRWLAPTSHPQCFQQSKLRTPRAEASYDPFKAYGRSKLANVLFTRALARRLEGKKVYANVCHPGGIHTNLSRHVSTSVSPELSIITQDLHVSGSLIRTGVAFNIQRHWSSVTEVEQDASLGDITLLACKVHNIKVYQSHFPGKPRSNCNKKRDGVFKLCKYCKANSMHKDQQKTMIGIKMT